MADHGINVSRADTAVATPNTATCGIPFVIGTAPLSKATGTAATAGLPVLCTSYDEAKEQLGYDDDWAKYTVCEVMYYLQAVRLPAGHFPARWRDRRGFRCVRRC